MTGLRAVTDDAFDVVPDHIASAELARFIDGTLAPAARDAVVAHLGACANCRREVVELREALAASVPRTRARSGWLPASLAAAAVILIAVVLARPATRGSSVVRADVAGTIESESVIVAAAPAEHQAIERGAVRFAWHRTGTDATYLVTVQDTTGTVVWSGQVTDTTATLPASAPLTAGQRYFWSVDARLGDGQSRKSGVHTFVVR
jgi:hypothetical protein